MSRFTLSHCLSFALLTLGVSLWATAANASPIIGSTATARSFLDGNDQGTIAIFAGDMFDSGVKVDTLTFFSDNYSGNRLLTPILFEQTGAGDFTVRGIGTSRTTTASSLPQSVLFSSIAGSDVTTNSNYTFGIVFGTVDALGQVSATSMGSVKVDIPGDSGSGVSGSGTNNWFFTNPSSPPSLAVGDVFSSGSFLGSDRTYSAFLSSSSTAAPEPGSLLLLTSGCLSLAGGIVMRRRKGGR